MELQLYNVAPRIPETIVFLEKLANNIWLCWHHGAIELFMRIDPVLWREVGCNAKTFLRLVPESRLMEVAGDVGYINRLKAVENEFNRQVGSPLPPSARRVAYFSLEYGIHESIPIFSGGLGVLAGDHLKAASDMNLPLVAVGLLYRQGYFRL